MEQFPEIRFENFGPPLEVILLSGNLEIPEIHLAFLPGMNHSQFLCSRKKLRDGGESFESTLHCV